MAYEHFPKSWEAKESAEVVFTEDELPAAQNNYSLCKVCMHALNTFNEDFYHDFEVDQTLTEFVLITKRLLIITFLSSS